MTMVNFFIVGQKKANFLTQGRLPFLTRFISVQLQIEEVSRKLRSGDLGIPANPEERFVNTNLFSRDSGLLQMGSPEGSILW